MSQLLLPLLIIGIVQGIAEFLPISSSGHIVILQNIPVLESAIKTFSDAGGHDIEKLNLLTGVALHIATLFSVLLFLRNDILNLITGSLKGITERKITPEIKSVIYILTASIPAGAAGILLNDHFEKIFASPALVFMMLIINGFILISTKFIPVKDAAVENSGIFRSVIVGFFQAAAIIPGISRSGMTITGGFLTGMAPVEAARFSFLMSVPVIAGAGLLEGLKASEADYSSGLYMPLSIAMIVTTAVGYSALKILYYMVKNIKLHYFGIYTIIAGLTGIIITKTVF
jgi:undecaprenyl-diphosphatase